MAQETVHHNPVLGEKRKCFLQLILKSARPHPGEVLYAKSKHLCQPRRFNYLDDPLKRIATVIVLHVSLKQGRHDSPGVPVVGMNSRSRYLLSRLVRFSAKDDSALDLGHHMANRMRKHSQGNSQELQVIR
jgi:hypothetical protein